MPASGWAAQRCPCCNKGHRAGAGRWQGAPRKAAACIQYAASCVHPIAEAEAEAKLVNMEKLTKMEDSIQEVERQLMPSWTPVGASAGMMTCCKYAGCASASARLASGQGACQPCLATCTLQRAPGLVAAPNPGPRSSFPPLFPQVWGSRFDVALAVWWLVSCGWLAALLRWRGFPAYTGQMRALLGFMALAAWVLLPFATVSIILLPSRAQKHWDHEPILRQS